jgi:predicted anti-sigma-YlaC factor YlaD
MKCLETEKIAAYLDGEIQDKVEIEPIEKHLQSCKECREWKALTT